jgi:hypothetical protein
MALEPKHVTICHILLSVFIGYCLKVDDVEHYCRDHMHTGKSHTILRHPVGSQLPSDAVSYPRTDTPAKRLRNPQNNSRLSA